jgi:hypothetical protein
LIQISKVNYSLNRLNNNKYLALGLGAFGVILLLSEQWLIALLYLRIALYFWQK